MTSLAFPPLCSSCARRDYTKSVACEAFPEAGAIPDGIYLELGDHRKPWPGDHGLRYVMVEGGEEDLAAYVKAKAAVGPRDPNASGDVTSMDIQAPSNEELLALQLAAEEGS